MPSNFGLIYSVIWTTVVIYSTICAPVQKENMLANFINSVNEENCSTLDSVVFPIYNPTDELTAQPGMSGAYDLAVPLEICSNSSENSPSAPICKEVFEVIFNISSCGPDIEVLVKMKPSVPQIKISLPTDNVCEGFSANKSMFSHNKEYFALKLADKSVCSLICRDKVMKACSFLLWSYQAQASIHDILNGAVLLDKSAPSGENPKAGEGKDAENEIVNYDSPSSLTSQGKKEGHDVDQSGGQVNISNEISGAVSKKTESKLTDQDSKLLPNKNKEQENQKELVPNPKPDASQSVPKNPKTDPKEGSHTDSKSKPQKTLNILENLQNIATEVPNLALKNAVDSPETSQDHVDSSEVGVGGQNVNKVSALTPVVEKKPDTENPDKKDSKSSMPGGSAAVGITKEGENNVSPQVSNAVTRDNAHQSATSNIDSEAVEKKKVTSDIDSEAVESPLGDSKTQGNNVDLPSISKEDPETGQSAKHDLDKPPHPEESVPEDSKETSSNSETPAANAPVENFDITEGGKDISVGENYTDQGFDVENSDQNAEYDEDNPVGPSEDVKPNVGDPASDSVGGENPVQISGAQTNLDANRAGVESQLISQVEATFPQQEDTHFFFYFVTVVIFAIGGYVLFHNKQKIFALIIEGRHERRRRSGASYRKLEAK